MTRPENSKKKNKVPAVATGSAPFPEPAVISETRDYLVINKPAGLAVHPGGNLRQPTLADWLRRHYPETAGAGEDPDRPGIVHRLDKEVSGLMVVARNQETFSLLKKQFQARSVDKEYVALVYGRVAKDEGDIDFLIKRARAGHKMAALPRQSENLLTRRSPRSRDRGNIAGFFKARTAATAFKVLERFVNYTLVRVKIRTGRTHQIRVHFFAYGHPLVGDDLYATKKTKGKNQRLKLGRIFLVADRLAFSDRKNRRQSFSLPLPAELKNFLPHS